MFIFELSKDFWYSMFVELHFQWSILGKVLQATDRRKVTFLDVLIECDQRTVVSNVAVVSSPSLNSFLSMFLQVQSYLNELWKGGLSWTGNSLKMIGIFFAMVLCPVIWIFFSLPLNIRSVSVGSNKYKYIYF